VELFKRSIVGSYHRRSLNQPARQSGRDGVAVNNRDNPYLFRDTLLVLLHSDPLPYKELVAKPGSRGKGKKPPVKPLDPEGH
jgi:hypothetical protein